MRVLVPERVEPIKAAEEIARRAVPTDYPEDWKLLLRGWFGHGTKLEPRFHAVNRRAIGQFHLRF
jgi:hypothetical protein